MKAIKSFSTERVHNERCLWEILTAMGYAGVSGHEETTQEAREATVSKYSMAPPIQRLTPPPSLRTPLL